MTNTVKRDEDIDEALAPRKYFSALKANAYLYEFYLSGSVMEPSEYIEWYHIIRNATEYDTVKIYLNSCGGNLDTALQFRRVLTETEANTVCSVEGSCMSAATMIMLACDSVEVSEHSLFMFHNYSGGTGGKGGEMHDQILFEREWSRRFLHDIYKWFFSEAEVDSMLGNRDIWMHGEEVLDRMKVMCEMMELEAEDNGNEK